MRLLFRLCHERRLFTSRERFSVTAHRFENFPRIVRSLFDATRDYAKRRNVSLSDITPRFWIACSRKTQNRDDTSRRFQKFEVLKYSFFPPTSRKKKKKEKPISFVPSFPGSIFQNRRVVDRGGDARLPDYLRSSERVRVRFFGSLRGVLACATVHVNEGPDHPFGFYVRSTPLDTRSSRALA